MTERQPICDQIAADAAGLMAMPAQAPERKRAEEHARGCDHCTRALEEARQLLAVIDGKLVPAPSAAALDRAQAPIVREFQGAPRFAAIVCAAVIAAAVTVTASDAAGSRTASERTTAASSSETFFSVVRIPASAKVMV